jgi:hypothetical protein
MEAKSTLNDRRGTHSIIHRSISSSLNERLSWQNNRTGDANVAACSQHNLLQPVTKGQNRTMASRKAKIQITRTPLHVQYIFTWNLQNIRQQCSSGAVAGSPWLTVTCVAASTSLPQTSILTYTTNYTSLYTAIFCSGSTWHPSTRHNDLSQ